MIKGISKQIIEVKCPNNEYFDKALLFVNSKNNLTSRKQLNEQAKLFVGQFGGSTKPVRRKKMGDVSALKIVFAAVISSAAVGMLLLAIALC